MRASSNPFFPYMLDRIGEGIPAAAKAGRPDEYVTALEPLDL